MADILDKDLNAYDNSPATERPYFLKESEVTPSSFITGEDLERTIRIQNTLKEPIPVELRAFTRSGKQGSGAEVPLTVISDSIHDIYEGTKVFAGTLGMQALDAEPMPIKALKKAGIEIPGITNEDSDFQKTIELLNGRTFPARKAISRVIARSTADIENRKIVRALYDQSHSIDPKAPQVMLPRMLVDAMLLFVPGKSAGLVSRFAGGSRYAATNLAKNITSGLIFAGEGGSYAAETVQEYIDRTGDKNLEYFTPEDAHALSALAVGAINTEIEKIGGVFPLMFGSLKRVGLRSNFGKVLAEGAVGEPFENFLQDITRLAARKIDGTTEKTWKDGIQEAFVNSLWTAPVGGAVGVYGHYSNRANLVKGIQATVPNITQEQATQVADAMIDTGIDVVLPNESLRKNLREKVALMYRDIDMDNKDDRIDAMTDLEYSLIAMDAIDRGIDIADHELFQGVVNELGWFRAGIPEAEREKIESINNNIRELRTQLEELNKAEEKDWAKIEEIENKLAQASQYVLENLTDVRKAFQELEDRYVEKQKKKARIPADTLEAQVMFQDQFDLADENARLDDIYPEYTGETIEVDGKERTVYNSNGERIAQSEAALRNFYNWFGDSKVVDEQGRPLVVYHGTNAEFDTFNENLIGKWDYGFYGKGFYFTDTKHVAEDYAKSSAFDDGGTATVMPVYLNLQNPFFMDYRNDNGISDEKRNRLVEQGYDGVIAVESRDLRKSGYEEELDKAKALNVEHWQLKDYEGNIVGRILPFEYVAWKSNQIKSVDNRGTFSEKTGNIYWQSDVYDGLTTTDSVMSVINTLRGLKDGSTERMLYDKRNKNWYLMNADDATHIDIFVKAFEQGNYPEFKNQREAEQFFQENYLADDQTLLQFLAQKYDNPADTKQAMEHTLGTDEYTNAYLRDNIVIYTRYDSDFAESGLPVESFDHYKATYDENNNRTITLEEKAKTNTLFQNRVSGGAPKTYRGAYIPEYRFILRANKMDASTLSHELAHDWMEVNFARYREGKASKDFMKAWGALEKALGIPEDATSVPQKASEAFARAYEAWIVQNEDWAKFIAVEDKDKDTVEKLMKDYQGELRDIYNDITSPYFKQTWGKIGELKPELKAWFDRVVNITDLDTMVERGEMTESQAANEKLNRAIDTVIENTTDSDTKQALTEAKVLNDTSRYEVEGGNKNSIQQRLSILAKDIDENNMVLKGEKYDTRRDMMQVAEAADNFVKTRLDDALAIINGEMAETEGLYKEDLYTALERLAVENGDLNLIDELKNSEVANRLAKELGQRVAGFRNIKQSTDIDVVSALKSLDMKFNKALDNKKAKQEYDAALKLLDESMKQQDKIADKELDNFLDELKCK